MCSRGGSGGEVMGSWGCEHSVTGHRDSEVFLRIWRSPSQASYSSFCWSQQKHRAPDAVPSTESKSDTFKGGQGILSPGGSRGQADYGGLQPGDIPSSPQTCLQLGPHRTLLLRLRLHCFMQWTHIFFFSY